MTRSKFFWIGLMVGVIGLYVLCAWLILFTQAQAWGVGLLVFLLLLHLAELQTARRIGRARGLGEMRIFAMTVIFGFTWWLAVKRGFF